MNSEFYRSAERVINAGLSRGARILLGSVAAVFGAAMVAIASDTESTKAVALYVFGAFCLLVAIACLTRGRVRQFVGSTIGIAMFAVGVAYLVDMLLEAKIVWLSHAKPSVLKAALYLLLIGIPGLAYAVRTRFGLRRP